MMFSSKAIVMMDFTEAYSDTCSSVGLAARVGDLGRVQDLVWHGKPVDVRDNRGWTPIHEAAFNGHSGCLEFLLRQENVDVDWRTFEEETPLILAARGGHFECLRTLLDCDSDPNAETKESLTSLWEATLAGSLECVRHLLRKGALINHQIYTGFTALHAAAEKGFSRIVSYLVAHGAQLDINADADLTPIFLASQFGHKECLRILLQMAKEKGQLQLVNRTTTDNATPVLIAAQEGHEDCIRLLLEVGANPNIPVSDVHAIASHFAVFKNRPRCLQLLLPVTSTESLFNNSAVSTMMHPLLLSLQLQETTCLEILIAAGLNVKAQLPVDLDTYFEDKNFLFNMLEYKTSASALCHVASDWPCQGVEFLLRAGLPCNTKINGELPPLISALSKGAYDLFLLLLKYGANPNIYHNRVGGNLAVLLALKNDLNNNVIVIDSESRRKLFGKYLCPLLAAGVNAQSCFGSLNRDLLSVDEPILDLYTVLEQCVLTNLFPLIVFLLCFTCNVHIEEKLRKLSFQNETGNLLQRIEDSSGSLAHACRKKLVLEFASHGQYTKEAIFSLPVPSILQEYLLFMEYGTSVSEIIQDSLSHFCSERNTSQEEKWT